MAKNVEEIESTPFYALPTYSCDISVCVIKPTLVFTNILGDKNK